MLRNEDLLIRKSICLGQHTKDEAAIAEIIASKLDWDYIIKQARENGVLSLLYKSLLSVGGLEKAVPLDSWSVLKNTYYSTIKRNVIIFKMLEDLNSCLQEEGVEIIILKGPLLIELVYKDIGMRPMADLDILIKKGDLKKIDAILKNNRYTPLFNIEDFRDFDSSLYRDTFSYQYMPGIPVDIHWHITNFLPFYSSSRLVQNIDMAKVWEDSLEIKLDNASLRTLSIYHQIICLCLHAFKHSYKTLIHLCDIDGFLHREKEELDWDILVKEAFNFGLSRHVYYGLYLTSQFFKTDIPEYALNKLKPSRISMFETRFIDSVLQGRPVFNDGYSIFLVYFSMNETLLDKFIFLRNVLFPPQKHLSHIRQKDASGLNTREYIWRFSAGLKGLAQFLFDRN